MSEGGGSAGPDIGPNYQNSGPASYSNPPSQPPTPSSTVQDPPNYQQAEVSENSNESKANVTSLHSNSATGLPPFSSFAASDVTEGLGGRLAGDGYLTSDGISSTRVMELSGWDYCYADGLSGRYLDRGDSMPVMIPQPQYRPWESKQDGSSDSVKSTLPSFQSQFGEELVTTLTTLTPAACSPAPSVPSPSLPSFHTLSTVNPRYPLVPAPVQAREIPSIQQQFLDERHIHLFQGPPGQNFTLQPQNGLNGQTLTSLNNGTTLTTLNNAQYHPQIINNAQILPSGQILAPQSHILTPSSQIITSNGHIITSSGGQGLTVVSQNSTPTVLTVVKTEPVNIVELKSSSTEPSNLTQLHHTNFQNPLVTQGQQMDSKFGLESPPRGIDGRKKERRKIRASSLESSNESDGAMSVESSGQVAAVSSTAGFKSPMTPGQMNNEGDGMITDTGEKQTKKKRKRCGECIGCQRKDNCGDCAPCRNDKSHQICKMRRCEKLTEKKHLLAYNREDGGVSYRGRGRGRGRGSRGGYRGKGARPGTQSSQVTSVVGEMNSAPGLVVGSNRENVKVDSGRVNSGTIPANPALAPTMAVPFYAGTEVWSASTPADPWASQGQLIHQIDDIRYQHYPGYQTTTGYQQTGFIMEQTSAFQPQYANNTNGNPATSPAQGNVTPRSTGSYTQVHTPTPSPNPSTPHVNGHRNGINVHYVEENYVNGTSFSTDSSMVPPASTTPNSRSSSVHMEGNESSTKNSGYMSGNEIPGYPLNSPQCQSSCNSSGYPGQSVQSEFGDQSANGNSYQTSNGTSHGTQKSPSYTQASPGTYQNYQNYNHGNAEEHQKTMKSSISPGSCHPSQKPSGMYPQSSPKSFSSNPSPQTYQDISPGQNRNSIHYENRTMGNGNGMYQNERFDQQGYSIQSPGSQSYGQTSPSSNASQDKSNVNARIKSMIMNKHQMSQNNHQQQNNYNENHMMSPGNEMMSPGQQHNVQLMSPMHQNSQVMSPHQSANQLLSPNHQNNQMISNNQINSPNSKDSNSYVEKIQQIDYGDGKKQVQMTENSNHFLAFSHHLRGGSLLQPEGGGVPNWTGRETPRFNHNHLDNKTNYYEMFQNKKCKKTQSKNIPSAMENIMRFANADFDGRKPYAGTKFNHNPVINDKMVYCHSKNVGNPIHNLEINFPTKRNPQNFGNCFKTENYGGFQNGDSHWRISNPYEGVVKQEAVRGNNPCRMGCETLRPNHPNYGYGDTYCEKVIKSEYPDASADCSRLLDYQGVKEEQDLKVDCLGMKAQFVTSPTTKVEYPDLECAKIKLESDDSGTDALYPRISYAPNVRNMEVIDRRFEEKSEAVEKSKWKEYLKVREQVDNPKEEKEDYLFQGDGGPITLEKSSGAWCCRLGGIEPPTAEHLGDGGCQGFQTADEFPPNKSENSLTNDSGLENSSNTSSNAIFDKINCKSPGPGPEGFKDFQENVERLRNNLRADVPDCQCFPPDKCPPEPGSYYTHLGAASSLSDLRKDVESRTGQTGKALRIEKICYTGKEGKTTQGCPLAKWVIRRSSLDEKFLIVVKHRQGHKCSTAWIVVCLVAWEGVPTSEADKVYTLLSHKLNRFGLPTTRRCATNEPRTCACQGLDPDTCGASFSFGCSWSMYYNGCKYARSKTVRKFRLSVRSEEQEVEERMHVLATLLSPLYNTLAPDAFRNQTLFEREASECRLGFKPGRPFSGVTACIDFCAHSHRDLHNMNNGCTVVVTLTKHRSLSKPDDEQLHVLPLYIMDETDEYGCKESQEAKYKDGSIECLNKFPCEVRVRAVPLQPCRRHGKKRKEEESDGIITNGRSKEMNPKNLSPMGGNNNASPLQSVDMQSMIDGLELQLQSSQVSSTVMDSPVSMYQGWNYQGVPENEVYSGMQNRSWGVGEGQRKPNWSDSSQWEYSGFSLDKGVDPDSTTNQIQTCSPISKPAVNPYTACNNPHMTSPYQNQPSQQWNQIQQNDDFKLSRKLDEEEEGRNNKCKQWPDHTGTLHPDRQNSPFRMPRGRPPSAHNSGLASEPNETFLKPLPRENNDYCNYNYNEAKEIDVKCRNFEYGKECWSVRGTAACGMGPENAVSAQNPFSSNSPQNFHCQKNNLIDGNFVNNYNFNENYNFDNEQKQYPPGNWPEYSDNQGNRYSYLNNNSNNSFSNVPPGRWDNSRWKLYGQSSFFPIVSEAPKSEPIGEVTDFIENEECFKDSQMGGVAIALGHGSVLFECAKHELHATTALKKPNRLHPTRISLVFYQHRNLNRAKHGWDEWEEKMRLRKLGINSTMEKKDSGKSGEESHAEFVKMGGLDKPLGLSEKILLRIPTYTTTTWTTLFPMRPCMVTGPYQEGGND